MDNRIYGYARVSSKDQNLDRQIDSLKKYVPNERDIIIDKMSGKDTKRPGLESLMYNIRNGDTLYIHSLDRLGRNKSDVKRLLTELKEKKVVVRILDLPTTMATYGGDSGQSIMELINDIIIEVMAYMAEAERMNIRKRQEEGIASAKARGVHFGREKYDFPESWKEDYDDWVNGRCTARSLMKRYNWSSTTFYRKLAEFESTKNVKIL